ncbi:MAG: DNA-directed RNA polymerase subunit alpha [Fretibacterium sp.]|nr:DNA-directed RNA polymerase subunit alpha [Fretibacterium sp.]
MLENLEILRPTLRFEENTPTYGRLSLEPLDRGYGMTLGNALRRVLLSSIGGAAITAVRIDGVLHEFSTIEGVREDVIEILMNLKHIPVRSKSKEVRVLAVDFQKTGVVTAGDIPADSEVEFIDPNAKICTMEKGAHLEMELYIEQGKGYLSAERPRPASLPVDALLTDAIFSPVLRVNYRVEAARVGQRTDYERLALELWTNGVVSPDKALGEASQIIQSYFEHIVDNVEEAAASIGLKDGSHEGGQEPDSMGSTGDNDFLARPIHDLEVTIRAQNCLLRGGIQTIGDLLQRSRDDLLKIRNLGKVSLTEIEEKLMAAGMKLREKKTKVTQHAAEPEAVPAPAKAAADKPAVQPEEAKDLKAPKEPKESVAPVEAQEPKEPVAPEEAKELKEPKEPVAPEEAKELKESKEPEEARKPEPADEEKTQAKAKQTKQADNAEEKAKEEEGL